MTSVPFLVIWSQKDSIFNSHVLTPVDIKFEEDDNASLRLFKIKKQISEDNDIPDHEIKIKSITRL